MLFGPFCSKVAKKQSNYYKQTNTSKYFIRFSTVKGIIRRERLWILLKVHSREKGGEGKGWEQKGKRGRETGKKREQGKGKKKAKGRKERRRRRMKEEREGEEEGRKKG
jgi:hypothetical protein